jgi:hypothetical protein
VVRWKGRVVDKQKTRRFEYRQLDSLLKGYTKVRNDITKERERGEML